MNAARSWLAVAAASLGVAALCALALVAGRLPLPGDPLGAQAWFRTVLVLHVDFALIFWLLAGMAALWSLDARRATSKAAALGAACALAALVAPLVGGKPILNNYVPVIDSPLFLGALAGFALAVAIPAARGLRGLSSLPRGSAWAMLVFLAALAAALISGFEARELQGRPRYEATFWAAGHLLQFVSALMLMRLWQRAAESQGVAEDALARAAYAFTAAFPLFGLLLLIGLPATDPGVRPAWTLLMAAGTWPGAALLAVSLLARAAHRKRFLAEAAPSALLFFLGALLGALISGDNASVPAHYHATVGAVTLALMAAAPALATEAGLVWPQGRAARLQPWLFAAGALLLVAGLFANGLADAPRKMPGAGGGGVGGLMFGMGGVLAVLGALLFCALAARACLKPFKEKATSRRDLRPLGAAASAAAIALAGAAIAYWPDIAPKFDPREQHVREMKLREIERRFGEGVVMLHARHYEHALTAFHRVLELDVEMPEAHVNAGFALLGMEKPGAARDFFLSAIELRTRQLNAYYGLAMAHERLGDLPAARGAMRTFAHLAPQADPFRRKAEAALWEWESAGKPR